MQSRPNASGAAWLLAASLAIFALVAVAHNGPFVRQLDERLLLAMREAGDLANPLGPAWFESAVRDVTALGSRIVLAAMVVAVAGYLIAIGRWRRACALLACAVTGSLMVELAKLFFDRPRPDLVPHGVSTLSLSFPSAHATQASVVYLSIAAVVAAHETSLAGRSFLLATAAIVALAVGLSRVYFGVHWPSDVAAGWALGAAWASACWLVEARVVQLRARLAIERRRPVAGDRQLLSDR